MRNGLLVAALCAASLPAQTIVAPASLANTDCCGTTGNWRGSVTRNQGIYDTTNFTGQGITGPIVITTLEWRPSGGTVTSLISFPAVDIWLDYSANDYLTPSTTFASNRSATPMLVYSGPLTSVPSTGTTPNSWTLKAVLTIPFVYDPTLGKDLLLEFAINAPPTPTTSYLWSSGSTPATHLINAVRNTGSNTATTGTVSGFCCVCRLGYLGGSGNAQVFSYGAGCYSPNPLTLAASARPVQGTNINLIASNLPATAFANVAFLGATKFEPGIDLTVINMPGCVQLCSLDVTLPLTPSQTQLGIPLGSHLAGLHVYSQAVSLAPGVNGFGALSSNGLDLLLGPQ